MKTHFRSMLLALVFPAATVWAQIIWDGGGANNNWSTPANWDGDAMPLVGENVLFDAAGLAVRQPTISAAGGVTAITLDASPIFTLTNFNGDFTVSGAVGGTGGFTATSSAASNFGRFIFTNTASDFDGDVTIQGTAIVRYNPGTTINTTFGDGDIVIDGGTFSLQGTAQAYSSTTGMPTGGGGADRNLLNKIIVTANGGTLNMNQGSAGTGAGLSFNALDLGGAISTSSSGGGGAGGLTIAGTVTLLQDVGRVLRFTNATGHNGNDWIAGQITDGAGAAGNALRLSVASRTLQISNSANNYAGGTIVEAGGGSTGYLEITADGTLGTGNLTVQSAGRIRLNNPTALAVAGNLAVGATIDLQAGGAVGVNGNTDISDRFTAGSAGVYGIEGSRNLAINLSSLGSGAMFLGSVSGGTYAGATLGAGAGSTYRLGGGSPAGNLNNLALTSANVLTGNHRLIVGSGLNTNASYGRVVIGADQDFVGDVTVNSDGLLATSINGGTPFGNTANRIVVHGTLAATSNDGVFNNAIVGQIDLRPGSTLLFNNLPDFNNAVGGDNANRWDDATGITLRGSALQLFGARGADSAETVGTVSFHDNSQIQVRRNGTSGQDVALTLAGVARQGRAVLGVNPGTAANLGGDSLNSTERFLLGNTSGLAIANGMVAPWAIDSTGNNFLRYDASPGVNVPGTRGLAPVTYTSTDPNTAGSTDIVNRIGTLSLSSNPTIHALRYNDTINVTAGNDTINLVSGGVLAVGNNKTVNAILDSGAAELVFWATGGNQNFSNNGALRTSGGFTKAGGSQLNLTNTGAGADYAITGGIVIQNGTIVSGSRFALALANNHLTVNHAGRLSVNDVNTSVLGLAGTGAGGNVFNAGANIRDLTLSVASGTETYEGAISQNLNLIKAGAGTQVLSGASDIAGGVTVQGGALVVDGSLAAASPLVVANGGTLGGSGSVGSGLTVQGGGTLSPGSSPGTLSSLGQTWMDGGNLNWQIHDANGAAGVGYDTLAITGTLDLAGLTGAPDFQINLWSLASVGPDADGNAINFNPNLDYTWTLATASGGILGFDAGNFAVNTAANNGTAGFANPLNGSFAVEVDGTALNLVYAAIPEPSTALVLLFGLAVLGWARRR